MTDPSNLIDETVLRQKLASMRQWGRWGDDDEKGAINLITPDKILRTVQLVREGRTVTLSRTIPTAPSPVNPFPAQHYMNKRRRGERGEGSAIDFIGLNSHGRVTTHIDALCHVWNHDGMWNGRNPHEHVGYEGVTWGDIDNWKEGIITRGVLIDVALHRPSGYVEIGSPVTYEELTAVAEADGLQFEPGDALIIHSGREAWERDHETLWGSPELDGTLRIPGLATSSLDFFKDTDCSMIVWDMMDEVPNEFGVPHTTHAAIFALGMALLDNALIEPLAMICRESNRHDFMIVVAPLRIAGGTGSPVNPIALM